MLLLHTHNQKVKGFFGNLAILEIREKTIKNFNGGEHIHSTSFTADTFLDV